MPVVTPEVVMEPDVFTRILAEMPLMRPSGKKNTTGWQRLFRKATWSKSRESGSSLLLVEEPFGSGGESILGYRTIYGESGSLTMSPTQPLNIRRARSEEEIEARTREEE